MRLSNCQTYISGQEDWYQSLSCGCVLNLWQTSSYIADLSLIFLIFFFIPVFYENDNFNSILIQYDSRYRIKYRSIFSFYPQQICRIKLRFIYPIFHKIINLIPFPIRSEKSNYRQPICQPIPRERSACPNISRLFLATNSKNKARLRIRMSRRFLEGLIVHRVVGIARHESRVDHLSIVSIGEKGPPRVYLPRNPGSFAVNRLIDTSRVPGPTQGGSLRAIDHWLVARTNNGSRYRSIFLEDDLMDTLLATSRAHRWLPCIYRYT